jgi:peptidoglycan/xylan/chitin deacetylase (PgdA/CDA1 family)
MRIAVKRLIGRVLSASAGHGDGAVAVLMYHSIGAGALGSQPVATFREQAAWLARHPLRFPVLPIRDALSRSNAGSGTSVLITFDDGYRDNSDVAAPILEEFGHRAVFFVSTAFIDGDRSIVESFRNYSRLPNMTWDQVAGLAERGHEIGLHGHGHSNYALLSLAEAEEDLERSMELVRSRTGYVPVSFAYPFGQLHHRRDDLAPAFGRLGIDYAFTTSHKRARVSALCARKELRLAIPRLRVDPDDTERIFVEKLRGVWDWVAAAQAVKSWPQTYPARGRHARIKRLRTQR